MHSEGVEEKDIVKRNDEKLILLNRERLKLLNEEELKVLDEAEKDLEQARMSSGDGISCSSSSSAARSSS